MRGGQCLAYGRDRCRSHSVASGCISFALFRLFGWKMPVFNSTKFHSPRGNIWFVSAALLSESLPWNNSFWTVWKKKKNSLWKCWIRRLRAVRRWINGKIHLIAPDFREPRTALQNSWSREAGRNREMLILEEGNVFYLEFKCFVLWLYDHKH